MITDPLPPLRTIGYEAANFSAVRDALLAAGVRLLLDVRALAASRKAGFSKRLLAASLAEAGIDYVHLQPLGTPKPGRDAVRRGDVPAMHRIFRAHIAGDAPQAALAEAVALARDAPACLLCFERDHRTCHRALVAEMVAASSGQQVVHCSRSRSQAELGRRRPSARPPPPAIPAGMDPTSPLVDAETFRNCLRHVPGAVAVITTVHEGVRAGLTATAVCSVSAEPPQMLVCVNRAASASPVISAAGRFGISFLAHDQRAIANAFAGPVLDRFASASWTQLASGIPLLDGAAAAFECEVVQAVEAGTHTIFIGAVINAVAKPGPNLVYKSGDFAVV